MPIPKEWRHPGSVPLTDYGLGHPYLLAPPWSQIIAYDLNRGIIKWRRPLGQDLDAANEGGRNDGVPRGSQRQGIIITSTGIVFSTARDGVFYGRDTKDGQVLWSHRLPWPPWDYPRHYQVKGGLHRGGATTPHTWD